jgi:glycosyltransferase involved in cell wall biosynthesis
MKEIIISVVIPLFNNKKYIKECIDSVLCQTDPVYEIIVIDDGSTDDSVLEIQEYIDTNKIRYYRQENMGTSAARNHGIKVAKGNYIAFLDADDVWVPEKIAKQKIVLSKNKDIGILHTNISCIDGLGAFVDEGVHGPKHDASGYCLEYVIQYCGIGLSSVIIPKHVLYETGLFDPSIAYTEDYELFIRVAKKYRIYHIDEALSLYRVHGDNLTSNYTKSYMMAINTLEILKTKFKNNKTIRKAINRGKSRFLFLISKRLLKNEDRRLHACLYLMRSIRHNILNIEATRLLLQTIIPYKAQKNFRWYKKKLLRITN